MVSERPPVFRAIGIEPYRIAYCCARPQGSKRLGIRKSDPPKIRLAKPSLKPIDVLICWILLGKLFESFFL